MSKTLSSCYKDYIEALNLATGESRRTACPECGKAHTFSLTRTLDGVVLYHCFSASCSIKGRVGLGLSCDELEDYYLSDEARRDKTVGNERQSKWDFRTVMKTSYLIDAEYLEQLEHEGDADGISEFFDNHPYLWEADLLWDYADKRLVFPLHRPSSSPIRPWSDGVIAAFGKRIDHSSPKWMNYNKNYKGVYSPSPNIWPGRTTLVLVEDIMSAMRVETDMPCISWALLGTNMTSDNLIHLESSHVSEVVICLDQDATNKSIVIQQQIQDIVSVPVRIEMLHRDIKSMTDSEIDALAVQING